MTAADQISTTPQFGQYPPATSLIVHLSDTHFLADSAALYGSVDTDGSVTQAMAQLERSGLRPAAIVLTGDIADRGEADAYQRVRKIVETTAERLGSVVVWVMGNHDDRAAFRSTLLREAVPIEPAPIEHPVEYHSTDQPSAERHSIELPVDQVFDIDGLRIIALDTTVPGYHHGDLTEAQLAWLVDVLSTPAARGTLLALHHPPVPTPLPLMSLIELREQTRLADVIEGSDIRAILGGHLHYATTGMFAGIPVSVAAATCYTMDVSAPERELSGVAGGTSLNLVHVYDDQIVHSVVPIGAFDVTTHFSASFLDRMEALSADERLEAFSRHA
ncbi:3',5'-cyclic adenosine monophosphate phosphodiesterase CpdA [Leifsonia kafniensis]|uniref:3',5'-cyclic adenosine monophosphate phosphodiesterase CpdA n=1 Tax=Leifsonia kafniensis TaxID=475957 RepID=A0ABP7KBA9_9MICO